MSETIEFQAEARQLLQLMIHSIYSDKDVFLRELVSNASDALDKVRLASYVDKDVAVETEDLHVDLVTDAEARTLTVRDNGIGMTREEVVELIGTIAKSGTAEMLASMKASRLRGADRRADRPVRDRLLLELHGRRPRRDDHPQGRHRRGRALGVGGGGDLHPRPRPGRPAGHGDHPAPQARGRRGLAARLREPGHGAAHRQALLRLHHLADPAEPGRRGGLAGARQLPQGALGALAVRGQRRGVRGVLPPRLATTGRSRWRPCGSPRRARSSTRRCCSCRATRRWTCSCASTRAACSSTSSACSSWTTARRSSPSTCASSRASSTRRTSRSTSRARSSSRTARSR